MTVIVLPDTLHLDFIALTWSFRESSNEITRTEALLSEYIPRGSRITIEENHNRIGCRYVFRLQYTSKRSGRTMCTVAKGEELPHTYDDALFYLRQLVLTPPEVAKRFNYVTWLEKRARQDAFLSAGKLSNIRVSEQNAHRDLLGFKDYRDTLPSDD